MTVEYVEVSFAYPDGPAALVDIDLSVPAGELLLVAGPSGSGKSTLLRAATGLVPHASGGRMSGTVWVGGRDTRTHHPRQLADVVGFVHQDPEAQFVVDNIERDIAFVLENLGVDQATMRRRVEEALDALAIAHLRDRPPGTLSGGERQRAAIAGALAAAPETLVLDEPTSQLDPQGADDVLAALTRLNHDMGTTVVLAEHRLERAAPAADRAILMTNGRIERAGGVASVLADYAGSPPVTHLGRLLGWDPPPLTVKEARARASSGDVAVAAAMATLSPPNAPAVAGSTLLSTRGLTIAYGGRRALGPVDLDFREGEVVAVLGRNGSGKTTLLRALAGLVDATAGSVERTGRVAYVPQDPNSLLFSPTVKREVAETLRLLEIRDDSDAVDHWLAALGIEHLADRHPRTLSSGERQRVAVAAVAVGGAPALLLDETTRGMDAPSRAGLERAVRAHAQSGGLVVLATHDVELAARVATRVVVLGEGDVVAEGESHGVLAGSLFAPQTMRVLPPALTVAEVEQALAVERDRH